MLVAKKQLIAAVLVCFSLMTYGGQALSATVAIDFGVPLSGNYSTAPGDTCSTVPFAWKGAWWSTAGVVCAFGVLKCDGLGSVTLCGSVTPADANTTSHLFPSMNSNCAAGGGLRAGDALVPTGTRFLRLTSASVGNQTLATVESAAAVSTLPSAPVSWGMLGWSFWSDSIYTCGFDITRTQPSDSTIAMGSGVEVVIAPVVPVGCVVATSDLVAAIALRYNLSCGAADVVCQVNDPITAVTLTVVPVRNTTNGFTLSLPVAADGSVCLSYHQQGTVKPPGARVTIHPSMLRNTIVDRQMQRLYFDAVSAQVSDPSAPATIADCVDATICTGSQVYVPQSNTCLDFACTKVWFKQFDSQTLTCQNRPFVLGMVLLLLSVIIVGEIANTLLTRRLRESLAQITAPPSPPPPQRSDFYR